MRLYAGTSGYSYPAWKGFFYPAEAKTDALLRHYAARLPSVEINNTFYRMPRSSVVEGWRGQVPADFRFAMKASRRITHFAKLRDCAEPLSYLLQGLEALGPTLGVVLFQMPPQFQKDVAVLEEFVAALPSELPVAMEFRHRSWFDDAVYGLLGARRIALVGGDGETDLPSLVPTANFGYLRLRLDEYDDAALDRWKARLEEAGFDHAFVFFKHEERGPHYALQMLGAAPAAAAVAAAPRRPGLKKAPAKPRSEKQSREKRGRAKRG
ncbi:MAG: DUF72 domain-containing protein [Polyangiaceae bacterium]